MVIGCEDACVEPWPLIWGGFLGWGLFPELWLPTIIGCFTLKLEMDFPVSSAKELAVAQLHVVFAPQFRLSLPLQCSNTSKFHFSPLIRKFNSLIRNSSPPFSLVSVLTVCNTYWRVSSSLSAQKRKRPWCSVFCSFLSSPPSRHAEAWYFRHCTSAWVRSPPRRGVNGLEETVKTASKEYSGIVIMS